jgi:hypothetical protein
MTDVGHSDLIANVLALCHTNVNNKTNDRHFTVYSKIHCQIKMVIILFSNTIHIEATENYLTMFSVDTA